jgi:ribosomal protein S18 acetylase RimI-like enzyme
VLIIRRANPDDAIDVLRWRNDAQTRAMSWRTDPIDPASHIEWFNAAVNDQAKILLIGNFEGKKIGMVRFDVYAEDMHIWKVNIVIAPESRSQGFGGSLLTHAISLFYSKLPEAFLIAEVKKNNTASQNLFERLGFLKAEIDSEKLEYKHSKI